MITERVFGVKCKICKSNLFPHPMHGFKDRIRFSCSNNLAHPSVIKLLRKGIKSKWRKYEKTHQRLLKKHVAFLKAMSCYLDYNCDEELDDKYWQSIWRLKCRACPRERKQACVKIEILDEIFCEDKS